jgi:hypothetical protein
MQAEDEEVEEPDRGFKRSKRPLISTHSLVKDGVMSGEERAKASDEFAKAAAPKRVVPKK